MCGEEESVSGVGGGGREDVGAGVVVVVVLVVVVVVMKGVWVVEEDGEADGGA